MIKDAYSLFCFSRAAQVVPSSLKVSALNCRLPLIFFLLEEIQPDSVIIFGDKNTAQCVRSVNEVIKEFIEKIISVGWFSNNVKNNNIHGIKSFDLNSKSVLDFIGASQNPLILDLQDESALLLQLLQKNKNINACYFDVSRIVPKDTNTEVNEVFFKLVDCAHVIVNKETFSKQTIKNIFLQPVDFESYLEMLGDRLTLKAKEQADLGLLDTELPNIGNLETKIEEHSGKLNVLYSMVRNPDNEGLKEYFDAKLTQIQDSICSILANNHQTGLEHAKLLLTLKDKKSEETRHVDDSFDNVEVLYLTDAQKKEILLIQKSGIFDHDYYLKSNSDLKNCDMDPLEHYVKHGAAEDRKPHFLFLNDYYKKQLVNHQDIEFTPLGHYLSNSSSSLSPHPLFDAKFYLDQVGGSVFDEAPFVHFVKKGGFIGLSPHRFFNTTYYAESHPEFINSGIDPLSHYLMHGSGGGFKPCHNFDPKAYLLKYPDVESAGFEALTHYVLYGQCEGRTSRHQEIEDHALYLPVKTKSKSLELDQKSTIEKSDSARVDVIIPVYNDFECTIRCLESVLVGRSKVYYKIIVVNDCTPDNEIEAYLNGLYIDEDILLIKNEKNLGFVESVNIGMLFSGISDVVLLNSDTVVPKGWLDNLVNQAYASEQVGTVCPFSNNATICNFPTLAGFSEFPGNKAIQEIHDACDEANFQRFVELPTAVGSCMYIKRACLSMVGLFDTKTWGAGYGEECDFSMRAEALGWKHILAADTFVFHDGEKSFKEAAFQRKKNATLTINRIYPDYQEKCQKFFSSDPAKPFRAAAAALRYKRLNRAVHLYIEHGLGGGVQRAMNDEIYENREHVAVIFLRRCRVYNDEFDVELVAADTNDGINLILRSGADKKFIFDFLKSCGVAKIVVHHTMGLPINIKELVEELQVPFDLSVHDYHYICPQVTLFNNSGRYCGEPDIDGCSACLLTRPVQGAPDIISWRTNNQWLFDYASNVTAPSNDTVSRLNKYFPSSPITLKPHESNLYKQDMSVVRLPGGKDLRVALLGVLALHKGAEIVQAVNSLIKQKQLAVTIKLIGHVEPGLTGLSQDFIEQTGRYAEEDLQNLINDFDPHLIWFSSLCPETYSYTLSAALSSCRPILAPDFGAFSERLQGRLWSWVYPVKTQSFELVELLEGISKTVTSGKFSPLLTNTESESGILKNNLFNIQKKVKPKILVIPEIFNSFPSPCAYVRALLPFTHHSIRSNFDVTIGRVDDLQLYNPDLVFTQRIAVEHTNELQKLLDFARKRSAKLVFDLDDNLLEVPTDHPDTLTYQNRAKIVKELVSESSSVWVSTEYLKNCVKDFNSHVVVIPNALDDRIWLANNGKEGLLPCPGSWTDGPVKILYMGTKTHDKDFDLIRPVFRELFHKWGNTFQLDVLGVVNSSVQEEWYNLMCAPENSTQTYPAFVTWLRKINCHHIGISPICDNHFSRSKSPIKFMDYSALGLASIVSDVEPYQFVIKNKKNGIIVKNSTEDWFDALDFMLSHEMERGMMRWAAYTDLRANHTLKQINVLRVHNLQKILAEEATNVAVGL
jgi:GT2 family glycosyltransferase/glycosyltransferase involved in cell wall biosynthesis